MGRKLSMRGVERKVFEGAWNCTDQGRRMNNRMKTAIDLAL
jgi:hypothetical protein